MRRAPSPWSPSWKARSSRSRRTRCWCRWCWRSRSARGGWRPIATAGSILGGLAGYAIGYFLFETVGSWIIEVYGLGAKFADFQRTWNEWGLWIILIKGLTPIPYKLVTIASGLAKFNLAVFLLASIVTRGLRFFLVAGLLRQFGTPIRTFIEQRLTLVTTGFAALIVLGFVVLRYL